MDNAVGHQRHGKPLQRLQCKGSHLKNQILNFITEILLQLVAKPTLWDRKACRNSSCMFGCPHMFGCPVYVWMPQYVWIPSYVWSPPTYVWMPPVCFDDVWIPPVHTQHKESMLCQAKGVFICPNTFGYASYVWMPPVCLDAPCMFGWPHMFGHPHICLDAPCMFGYPPYVWTCPYVWMPPVCLDDVWMSAVHTQHKESMLC